MIRATIRASQQFDRDFAAYTDILYRESSGPTRR